MPTYIGESVGGRIIALGSGLTSLDTNHQGDFLTWDVAPAGEMGDCVFRSVGVSFIATNGWSLGITTYVDGVSLGELAKGGTGATENGQAQIYVNRRGARIAVRVRTLSRSGLIAFTNAQISYRKLREWP